MTNKDKIYAKMEAVKKEIDKLMVSGSKKSLNDKRKELVDLTDSYRKADSETLIFRIPKETKTKFKLKTKKDKTTMTRFILDKINEYVNK
jgi:predicted HicB family RNase H-like nuclease